jgi:hypothetical protein
MMPDAGAGIRSHLEALMAVRTLGPSAVGELERVRRAPQGQRAAGLRALVARPAYANLATLIAIANTDEVVRLRLLRAIRDVTA